MVGADDELVVSNAVVFATDGTIFIYGRADIQGRFRWDGPVINRGTLITRGLTVNGATIENSGLFLNLGWLHTHGAVINYATSDNGAGSYLETCSGPVHNYGFLHNAADVENWGTLIVNHGVLSMMGGCTTRKAISM